MRHILLALLFVSSVSFAQDSSESVTVTGSRIWPPAGPITTVGVPDRPRPCADPTCGGTIEKPEPGQGDGTMTQTGKNNENKDNKNKAKAILKDIKDSLKGSLDVIKALKKWLTGDATIHWDDTEITVYPDGRKTIKGNCLDVNVDLGDPSTKDLPCVDIKGQPEQIKRSNGTVETQLRVTYRVFYPCYYEKKCGVRYLSFVAGTPNELASILNDVVGESYF